MEAVKDGTFEEKLRMKKLAKEFMRKAAQGDSPKSTEAMARGRDLHATMHPTTNEEEN